MVIKFKDKYINIDSKDVKLKDKKYIKYHLHQKIIAKQIANDYKIHKQLVFGIFCVCRSGKSYIMAGSVDFLKEEFKRNFKVLIITPRPSESISSLTKLFKDHCDFDKFHIVDDHKLIKNDEKKVIHIFSKQYLQRHSITENKYNLIMFDEASDGGTTWLSKEIINKYSDENTIKIFITATYSKARISYKIPDKYCYMWDLKDIKNMKNGSYECLKRFDIMDRKEELTEKYLIEMCGENVKKYYNNFPKLVFYSGKFKRNKIFEKKLREYNQKDYGFDFRTLFSLNKNKKFQNTNDVRIFLNSLMGTDSKFCNKKESILSRVIEHRQMNIDDPFLGMMWFLPYMTGSKINDIANELKKYINETKSLENYEVVLATKIKRKCDLIEELIRLSETAKRNGKSGIIVLTALKCSLAISLPFIDVVCLFNHFTSADLIYQMMHRSMTERDGKKFAYVIDFNINRVLKAFKSNKFYDGKMYEEEFSSEVIGNVIEIDPDYFNFNKENREEIIQKFKELWHASFLNDTPNERLKYFWKNIEIEISVDMRKKFDKIITGLKIIKTKTGKKTVKERDKNIEKKRENKEEDDKQEKKLSDGEMKKLYEYIIFYYIGLLIIVNQKNEIKNINNIINKVMTNEKLSLTVEQKINTAFGKKIPLKLLNKIIEDSEDSFDEYVHETQRRICDLSDKKEL